jgi:uncharacterized protein YciI
MLILAFCQDSPLAREGRSGRFVPHMRHLVSVMQCIRVAAPLATADDAVVSEGDRLVASVFVLESASLGAASDLMAADPYTSPDVWQCVSLFTVNDESGQWLSAPEQSAAPGRLYAALSPVDGAESFAGTALFRARLELQKSLGDPTLARSWQSVCFFAADCLDEAQSMFARAQVWAIPMTAGSWSTKPPL